MTKNRAFITFAIAFIFLSACTKTGGQVVPVTVSTTPVANKTTHPATSALQLEATWIAIPSETPSEVPSETQFSTATYLPKATPWPKLPVDLEMPVPQPTEAITAGNASQIVELARYGSPVIWNLQLTGDGTKLFASTSGGVMVFNAATDELLTRFDVISHEYAKISTSDDGSRMLIVTNEDIRVYDGDGSLIQVLMETPAETKDNWAQPAAVLSPNGQIAAIGYGIPDYETYNHQERFDILLVDTGEVVFSERGLRPVFSPDGSLMAVEWDGKVMIYDASTWEKVTHLSLWQMFDSEWTFSPDGSHMAISSSERVEIWDIASRRAVRSIDGYEHNQWDSAAAVRWSPNGSLISIADSCKVSTWEVATGNLFETQALGNCKAVFMLGNQGNLQFVNPPAFTLEIPTYEQRDLVFTSDSIILTVDDWIKKQATKSDYLVGEMLTFSLNGEFSRAVDATGKSIFAVDSAGNPYSISGNDETIAVLNQRAETILTINSRKGYALRPIYLSDQIFVYAFVASHDFTLVRLDRNTLKTTRYNLSGWLVGWDVSPGRLAVLSTVGGGHSVMGMKLTVFDEVLRIITQKETGTDNERSISYGAMHPISFHPYDEQLAYTENSNTDGADYLRFLDLGSQKLTADILLETDDWSNVIKTVTFSPDGNLVAVGWDDGRIMLIDAERETLIHTWQAHRGGVINMAFAPDSTRLATSSEDGLLKIWGIWP